jgi:hypothetical protein
MLCCAALWVGPRLAFTRIAIPTFVPVINLSLIITRCLSSSAIYDTMILLLPTLCMCLLVSVGLGVHPHVNMKGFLGPVTRTTFTDFARWN